MKKCSKWIVTMLLCGLVLAFLGCTKETLIIEEGDSTEVVETIDEAIEEAIDEAIEEAEETENSDVIEEEELEELEEFLVVIDAGHQRKGNSEKEPVGPGAIDMKAKVTGGTTGISTGLTEYELNLQVAFKLQTELESRGYTVVMVRTEHDVNLSNSERAMVANEAGADAFIRIHANGSENGDVNGAMTICQTKDNVYNGDLYEKSKALSTYVLDCMVEATGCKKQYVWETDTMSGVNWAQVPVTIVEMGYMSNVEEDEKMATEEYQEKITCDELRREMLNRGYDGVVFSEPIDITMEKIVEGTVFETLKGSRRKFIIGEFGGIEEYTVDKWGNEEYLADYIDIEDYRKTVETVVICFNASPIEILWEKNNPYWG